jgi:poly-gamma-glutamate capsule biosynthesis protein CapA/YwtB (metallophosphatase superfamily)
VLAHHPHVLQGMELYEGSIIAYSLGNFIFPGMSDWYSGEETGVLEMHLYDGRIIGVDFRPVLIDNIRLRRADGSGIAERFWEMSSELAAEVP